MAIRCHIYEDTEVDQGGPDGHFSIKRDQGEIE
jgi:hypothetical protein